MNIKVLFIFAVALSVSNSAHRIKPSTYRYALLNILFLHNMESYIKEDPIKFVECYKYIHFDYKEALRNFTDSMKIISSQVYKKYPEFKADEKRASYGSVLTLMDIGQTMMKFEDKVWESILLGDYDIIRFVNQYTHMMRYDIGEEYDVFLKKIKLLEHRRFEREEAIKNDIAEYRDPVLNRLKAISNYLKICMKNNPIMKIPKEKEKKENEVLKEELIK